MKKSVIMAVLGVAASVASSYGQGLVTFTTYSANNGYGGVTISEGTSLSSVVIPDGFTLDLFYSLTAVSDPVNNALGSSITALPGAGLTDLLMTGETTLAGGANPDPRSITIPGWTAAGGAPTFEVVAFNGSTYANSTIRGRSGSFLQGSSLVAVGSSSPVPNLGDTASGSGPGGTFPSFYVTSVPEPTTLALAGLGGLASLVAFRRKQA
jgi:hypothetical protein